MGVEPPYCDDTCAAAEPSGEEAETGCMKPATTAAYAAEGRGRGEEEEAPVAVVLMMTPATHPAEPDALDPPCLQCAYRLGKLC